ncbi:MAG: Nif3-like dinuclear metal center hexameric protein [Candidatus Thioglobus sp.]|uniref:Nif3-like dinuclear metal center hexameric protein n=1 Tax=Candidatus Thioglobus sp. TaxID=2026721 RepID=UPI00260D4902|nr:Nif3-like dinuclear metal center hexameric protein [Candidatus Thioglobus sp.]MDC9726941.1 Nif3-like dinuclear metal center hexameric protein [Candidatus Thioglobus sp.]
MINNKALEQYINQYLNVANFSDYCPNGLQIEGKSEIFNIISGVSANQALIDQAIDEKADALLVHHGFFWKGEDQVLTGIKKNRIKALLENDINLYAYHLPLDAHPVVGNNMQLAMRLNIQNPTPIGDTLVWQGEVDAPLSEVAQSVMNVTARAPQVFGEKHAQVQTIAWCSGGAQSYIKHAIDINADCFITGEVSEQIPAIAKENNIAFIAAGHHATERYGVQALAQHLAQQFSLGHQYIDIDNIV